MPHSLCSRLQIRSKRWLGLMVVLALVVLTPAVAVSAAREPLDLESGTLGILPVVTVPEVPQPPIQLGAAACSACSNRFEQCTCFVEPERSVHIDQDMGTSSVVRFFRGERKERSRSDADVGPIAASMARPIRRHPVSPVSTPGTRLSAASFLRRLRESPPSLD